MEIIISFIEKIGKDENFIMTIGVDVYPSYKAGDYIFLQKTNTDDHSKDMKVTQYKIEDVTHSVREHTSKNFRSEKNVLGIVNFLGLEVYVREIE